MTTVPIDQDADSQREATEGHGVGVCAAPLRESPVTIESGGGWRARMMIVSRQLPGNSRIIKAVSPRPGNRP